MQRRDRIRVRRVRVARRPAIVVGLGPIGVTVGRLLLQRPELFRLTAAIDIAPEQVGRPLREVLGPGAPRGVVRDHIPAAPGDRAVAFLTTSSSLAAVSPQILTLLERGYHVVSSTEELAYPHLRAPRTAARLQRAARRAGRCVIGTGINPGWAMDAWPLALAGNLWRVDAVHVRRAVDARTRRLPLQRKVGAGMTRAAFERRARAGTIGHVGLAESAAHLASRLGWELDDLEETLVPRVAATTLRSAHLEVPPGKVCGIHHRVRGRQGRRVRIDLDLVMALDVDDPFDEVVLRGDPPLTCRVPGGYQGDPATAAQLVRAATRLADLAPGLHLASDLPAAGWQLPPVEIAYAGR